MNAKIQIRAAAILALFLCGVAAAGADTNIFPVLTAGGQCYTNARIDRTTPVEAIVYYDAGIARVALSNLPQELREKYGYDPKKAAAYLAAQKQKEKEQAAQLQAWRESVAKAANARGEAKEIQVLNITGSSGFTRCLVDIGGEQGEIFISNLPDDVGRYLATVSKMQADIAALDNRIANEEEVVKQEDTVLIGNPYLKAAHDNQIKVARQNIESEKTTLDNMESALGDLKSPEKDKTKILAAPTSKKYANLPVWDFVAK